ncbi:MAG: proline--tRNA ligase [Candidatus Hydrothermarchaeota archaeon]
MENNNFGEWFNKIIESAEILDVRYPIKGLYVWFPYGFKIRKRCTDIIRELLDETGHEETLFPLLIPEDELGKESTHIKGFEDEVFWVTHGGSTPLNVKLALRPTSETAIYPMFSLWIRSHKDMPIKVYQIVSTFRYETKHTRPLLRLREITTFKEAHTAHATMEDAEKQVEEAIEVYKRFFDRLCIPYMITRRPDWDKFPGAIYTIAFDTIFPDGRTLQIGTVHNLGQTFSKTFDIVFETETGDHDYAYQTCYGMSDRVIASIIAIHGDKDGLILPPSVAPYQVVLVPILYKNAEEEIRKHTEKIEKTLRDSGIKYYVDWRNIRPGRKYYDWEIKGVPLRIEIGPKDAANDVVTVVRRDTREKAVIDTINLSNNLKNLLKAISSDLKEKAWRKMESMIKEVETIRELNETIKKGGVIKTGWCNTEECGREIEEISDADIIGIPLKESDGVCIVCRKPSKKQALIAKTY